MIDLGGYVIILVETTDKKIKLYGSPADRADLEVGDEILEINGRCLEDSTHTEVLSHIHQCIKSRTICLRVKRKSGKKSALDLAQENNVQDAFVIAVEQQAKDRLEKLSALKKIKPVDMTKLSQQFLGSDDPELSGLLESNPVYNISVPELCGSQSVVVPAPAKEHQQQPAASSEQQQQPLPSFANGPLDCYLPSRDGQNESRGESKENPAKTQLPEICLKSPEREINSSAVPARHRDHPSAEVSSKSEQLLRMRMMKCEENRAFDPFEEHARGALFPDGGKPPPPHREMAVDVPDSFVARTKTPPRYPPPKLPQGAPPPAPAAAAEQKTAQNGVVVVARANESGKAAGAREDADLPKRKDMEKKLANAGGVKVLPTVREVDNDVDPEVIRRYQEDIHKEELQRAARHKEEMMLRESIRESQRLKALEESKAGVENTGFSLEEEEVPSVTLRQVVDVSQLGDLLARVASTPSLKGCCKLAPVEALLRRPEFARVVGVYNKIQECWQAKSMVPVSTACQDTAQECLGVLQQSTVPDAIELIDILNSYDVQELLQVHDRLALHLGIPKTDEEVLSRVHQYAEDKIKVVKVEKTNDPLGATILNEGKAVIIGRVIRGGIAEKSGLLHEGDELLEVNGTELRGKNVNEICDILSRMSGTLVFLVVPSAHMHVKAHFDYDPEEDLFIPCRELGISFQKGDILHVINQDDPNWWQAYREGEEDQSLAGLIPSMSFQLQREAAKQAVFEDAAAGGGGGSGGGKERHDRQRSGRLLCVCRRRRRRRKKGRKVAQDDGGGGGAGAAEEEAPAYEEVALYYPRTHHRRPVVLIGPPNVGRHELRQKLMERDPARFAAAVPHTSRPRREGETDGQDYHFSSRAQFEADIRARRFVEHGEYERAHYGTSLDAIRAVVASGRVCVLNLHPQSLRSLRTSDLKPFVVFVCPPNLEVMRRNRARMGAHVKDDELKHVIEKAREIEERYGHYFDLTLVNMDVEKVYQQLVHEVNLLEREPQWVPAQWLRSDSLT